MKILIVEDQQSTGLSLSRTVELLGHESRLVTTGVDAWNLINLEDWRLVITDWMMPEMDGLELCRRIRTRVDKPYIYVVMLTGRTKKQDRMEWSPSQAPTTS